jgi:hypothetical protein
VGPPVQVKPSGGARFWGWLKPQATRSCDESAPIHKLQYVRYKEKRRFDV